MGIVQGMCGNPILRDGKIVGVVTHVLVKGQTTWCGILLIRMQGERRIKRKPPKVLLYHLPFQKRQVVIQIQFNKCRYSSAG